MTKIIQRHDTAANWTSVNPTLSQGEFGVETDTGKFKIGDGQTVWTSLPYASSGEVGGSGLEICDIGMALYVDETKGLRRYLNGQIVDINANTQAFLNRLLEIKNTNPEYFTTEDNWQAEALLNIDGCVYKFVLNYSGADVVSVRLPKYPDYVEINSINSTAPVQVFGNGNSLGLSNGVDNFVMYTTSTEIGHSKSGIGSPMGTDVPFSTLSDGRKSVGVLTNPVTSGLVGTANLSTSQTKLKMRYFIQIATGSETENNIVNDIELNNPYSLFDSKYSDHELNNLSWLKSEGQWNAKAVYPTAYDKLLKVYNGTETVEGLSVKLSTETYTDYDFVLNTSDETFRLPLKTKLASGKAVVGNGISLGLTNGTKNGGLAGYSNGSTNANIAYEGTYGVTVGNTTTGTSITGSLGITTDPTKSGIETSDSGLYLYYYVGETVQNANLIDAGRIGEQLATKTDMLQASGAGMPSNRYIDLTLGVSNTTYTAPANGYFYLHKRVDGANQALTFAYNNNMAENFAVRFSQASDKGAVAGYIPCKKDTIVGISYNAGGQTIIFRFYYAEGEI